MQTNMTNKLTLTIITTFIFLLTLGTAFASSPDATPNQFYGDVVVNGEPAPEGLQITAEINNEAVGSSTTDEGTYSITVSSESASQQTVTLFVEGIEAGEGTFEPRTPQENIQDWEEVNLEADGVTFGDQDNGDDSSDDTSSGDNDNDNDNTGGSSLGSVTTDVNETEETTTESPSESDQNSDTEETTQETTETTNVTSDDSNTEEDVTEEETTEEPTQESNPILDAMTGFVTGVGDQAGLTGGLFLILILTGLVGGYIYYNSKE